jgi:hypothetical protein
MRSSCSASEKQEDAQQGAELLDQAGGYRSPVQKKLRRDFDTPRVYKSRAARENELVY